ncbi:TonB-dependent receptor plug domain-containing protein [Microvirga thermotolerans]|uniref:TonB-dependent receptor n=1 Tax=Microvirga thermotolerans TaxID=2651334 RepID=A0A5P9JV31_9HYPH|nr:TonB-dependent receptor [Microvirga thermotolerans]QFU15506.1 TonB-dependent receptor [Microvirga thermotolerans]
MPISLRCLLAASVSVCALVPGAHAQSPAPTLVPDIVVTATRSPQAISRAGSAISVISGEDIAKESPKSVAEVLRRVPGVSVSETGGPGGTTSVRIRGAEARHTLVLIDGVRVNDPSAGAGEFDFANLEAVDIERIEVLRGPQSALYGSDALGGVINIITRKGTRPRASIGAEGGSYGTKAGRAAVSGSSGPVNYAFSATGFDTAGFSRYGYRIGRIERLQAWPLEADSARRLGATGRVGIALSPDAELEVGGYASYNGAQYDAAFGTAPDTPSQSQQRLFEGHTRLTVDTFDRILRNTFLISGSRTNRHYRDVSYFGLPLAPSWLNSGYEGDRVSGEYQGDLKLGTFGLLTFGAKIERERFLTTARDVLPFASPWRETNDASRDTRSVYALHQFSLFENLHLSFGGRLDAIEGGDRFGTWRATAAYEIPQTGTTLRASLGTGAKAPSLFQLYDPLYGTPGLEPERSIGADIGLDQRLIDDRLVLSATFFANRFRDLIDFSFSPADCPPGHPYGCYLNVARARTSGVELSAEAEIVPSLLRAKAVYTHTDAFDLITHLRLARRPQDEGRLGLVITPAAGLSIEPSVVFVGKRFSSTGEKNELAPYARLDVYADYKLDDTLSLYVRAENLTDARYQDIYNYGTAGRSFYAGLRATW